MLSRTPGALTLIDSIGGTADIKLNWGARRLGSVECNTLHLPDSVSLSTTPSTLYWRPGWVLQLSSTLYGWVFTEVGARIVSSSRLVWMLAGIGSVFSFLHANYQNKERSCVSTDDVTVSGRVKAVLRIQDKKMQISF